MQNNPDFENKEVYKLKLYVAGASPNSLKAISNIKKICEKHLRDRYELEVIDVHQQPSIAQTEQIIALPLLIKKYPLPERQFVGDMSDTAQVLRGFGI